MNNLRKLCGHGKCTWCKTFSHAHAKSPRRYTSPIDCVLHTSPSITNLTSLQRDNMERVRCTWWLANVQNVSSYICLKKREISCTFKPFRQICYSGCLLEHASERICYARKSITGQLLRVHECHDICLTWQRIQTMQLPSFLLGTPPWVHGNWSCALTQYVYYGQILLLPCCLNKPVDWSLLPVSYLGCS